MNIFNKTNPDYPVNVKDEDIEKCEISDEDIPSGSGGINGEMYTYGRLRREPIIPEILSRITNKDVRKYAEVCNSRNADGNFTMFRIEGEYCFWRLRVGPTAKLPSVKEMRDILMSTPKGKIAVLNKCVTTNLIREITYDIIIKEIEKDCQIDYDEAKNVIGNILDCAPHEDETTHLIFMVPNWAHRWFRHSGYASHMAHLLNQSDDDKNVKQENKGDEDKKGDEEKKTKKNDCNEIKTEAGKEENIKRETSFLCSIKDFLRSFKDISKVILLIVLIIICIIIYKSFRGCENKTTENTYTTVVDTLSVDTIKKAKVEKTMDFNWNDYALYTQEKWNYKVYYPKSLQKVEDLNGNGHRFVFEDKVEFITYGSSNDKRLNITQLHQMKVVDSESVTYNRLLKRKNCYVKSGYTKDGKIYYIRQVIAEKILGNPILTTIIYYPKDWKNEDSDRAITFIFNQFPLY